MVRPRARSLQVAHTSRLDFIRFHHGEFIVKREKIVVARDKLTRELPAPFIRAGKKSEM